MLKPNLAVVPTHGEPTPFQELTDDQLGPLAEAIALADVLNILAVDDLPAADGTLRTLTRMLRERVGETQRVIEAGVNHG